MAAGPFLSALPLSVVRAPVARRPPRLAYSTNTKPSLRDFDQGKKRFSYPRQLPVSQDAELRRFANTCHTYANNMIGVPEPGGRQSEETFGAEAFRQAENRDAEAQSCRASEGDITRRTSIWTSTG